MKIIRPLPLLLAALFLGSSSGRADISIASLSTITTDLAKNIGGNHVTVVAVIRSGIDPHEFEPTPGDVRKVADANLVLFTGKGIEGYLTKLEEAADGGSSKFLNIGTAIPSLTMREEGNSVEDPHWWHSVGNMKRATRVVAAAFAKADPANAASYQKNAQSYLASLDELQRWIRVKLAGLSHDQRKLVTSHDALQYFAHDYGFTIYPLKGISTNEEPSSRHVREIIEVIRGQRVKAVFFESIENPQAIEQISRETGARTGYTLYSDGLGEAEANTYDSMMRHNVSAIVDGLK
ncbi:MAG: metal ABC transporter substrate-binding protein [Verrucomicrobia bacterium]|nr:metal ABC transporter substrate-binding protein [Verrucomicrobiota bacterium]